MATLYQPLWSSPCEDEALSIFIPHVISRVLRSYGRITTVSDALRGVVSLRRCMLVTPLGCLALLPPQHLAMSHLS